MYSNNCRCLFCCVFVKIDQDNNKLIFATAYFPPRNAPEKYLKFAEAVDNLPEEYPGYNICELGAFNLPDCQQYVGLCGCLGEGLLSIEVKSMHF